GRSGGVFEQRDPIPTGGPPRPLVVDLDGTLIRADLLYESMLDTIHLGVGHALRTIVALFSGKASLKQHLADASAIDYASLPYDREVLRLIDEARAQGRKVYLATASDERHARAVAQHLNVFDGYFASDGRANLSSTTKAETLVAAFGERGFDYV